MKRLTEEELRIYRMRASIDSHHDNRCSEVDSLGRRCLVRQRKHLGPHDFSYTPWSPTLAAMNARPD
jgi:hypothetical protein